MTTLNPDSPLRTLMETFPMEGRLEWIGLRPGRRAPLLAMNHVEVLVDYGLVGDHKAKRAGGKRQVTLIQREHLAAVAQLLRREAFDPALLKVIRVAVMQAANSLFMANLLVQLRLGEGVARLVWHEGLRCGRVARLRVEFPLHDAIPPPESRNVDPGADPRRPAPPGAAA